MSRRQYSTERQSEYNRYSRPNSSERNSDNRHDNNNNVDSDHDNDNDDIKPYTAVGAALDSATRFKRRMNYGRITPNP